MGRLTFYRQRIRYEAATIEAKTLFDYLVNHVRQRREVSWDEAVLIASDALGYLNTFLGMRKLGQIEFPAVVAGKAAHFRRSREEQEEKLVSLTIIADDDASLLGEFGTRIMVTNRIARVIEEAWYQGGLLDMNRLCILFPLNVTAIRDRLKPLLELGAFLPLAEMSRPRRSKFKALRPVLAVERYLNGENLTEIRRSLCLSRFQWREWYQGFRRALKLKDRPVAEIAQAISQPVEVVEGWLQLAKNLTPDAQAQKILAEDAFWPWEARDAFTTSHGFRQLLQERHGFSPAAAEDFCLFLRDLARQFSVKPRSGGQIIYIGVASTEGPGRSLKDSRLEAVRLDYLTPQDWAIARRTTTRALKWARIERFATQAYAQGAALSLPDIAYLVSASVDAVRDAIARHPTVVLPTRGNVADMGSALSHAEKIIDLFMYGYTETEITRRTGHSYESIEQYLLDFARVVYLAEAGMPIPAIRQVTGFSKRLVAKYNTLYQKYNTPRLCLYHG